MFHLALGYFISYLPYAFLAKALSSGIGTTTLNFTFIGASILFMLLLMRAGVLILSPDVADRTHCLAGSDIPEPSATSLDDHRHTAVVIQQAMRQRLVEQFP